MAPGRSTTLSWKDIHPRLSEQQKLCLMKLLLLFSMEGYMKWGEQEKKERWIWKDLGSWGREVNMIKIYCMKLSKNNKSNEFSFVTYEKHRPSSIFPVRKFNKYLTITRNKKRRWFSYIITYMSDKKIVRAWFFTMQCLLLIKKSFRYMVSSIQINQILVGHLLPARGNSGHMEEGGE